MSPAKVSFLSPLRVLEFKAFMVQVQVGTNKFSPTHIFEGGDLPQQHVEKCPLHQTHGPIPRVVHTA